jgi:thioredoxin reductase
MSLHQALLLPEWGEVTLLTNGTFNPDRDQRAELSARGVTIEEEPIVSLEGHANVRLTNGCLLPFAGIFTAPRVIPATPLAEGLGCALEETPLGLQIRTDATKETSVSGAFACGYVARVPHSLSLAVGDGAWAGVQVHRSLVF